jgi:hypothetical protein
VHRWHHEDYNLSPEGLGPKAFGSAVCDAHFPNCFWALGNIVKYDIKMNTSVWLEDYRLIDKAGGVNDDTFII